MALSEEKTASKVSYHLLVVRLRLIIPSQHLRSPRLFPSAPCDGFLVWAHIFEKIPGRWSQLDRTTRIDSSSSSLDWCNWRYSLRTAGFCLLLLEMRYPVVFMTSISVFRRSSKISGVPVLLQQTVALICLRFDCNYASSSSSGQGV